MVDSYKEIITRPFEFIAEKLSPVDAAVIYCDADLSYLEFISTKTIMDLATVKLVSNKALKRYSKEDGIYVKRPSRQELQEHIQVFVYWLYRGACFCEIDAVYDESYKQMEYEFLGTQEDYVFVTSCATRGAMGYEYPFVVIPSETIIAHEITHNWTRKNISKTRRAVETFGIRDDKIASEIVSMGLDFQHILEFYPELAGKRIELLGAQIKDRDGYHRSAAQICIELIEKDKLNAFFETLRSE